jgi:uncharacterized protein with HEPN domain
MRPERTPKTL